MKEQFIVAQNTFSVSVPENLPAWTTLIPRFHPFATDKADKAVLEVDIRVMPLPECDAEIIYEPENDGIGFITARARRLQDDCLVMEFRHIEEPELRVSMKMPPELNKAEILIAPDGDSNDSYFLTHALMIAFMLATCGNGTLLIHSSSIIFEGKAYLFQGRSGTGKSTHARLWTDNIDGAELLNDDNPIIRFSADGKAIAYGSPWSGKTRCYRNISAPIGAFVRIVRATENVLRPLSPLKAYTSLTSSIYFMPFLNDRLRETRHKTIERLVGSVSCYEMHCLPDADAAYTCKRGVTDATYNSNK